MSSNNKASEILQEEQESLRRGACSNDNVSQATCSICFERIVGVQSVEVKGLANKCRQCLRKINATPSGFPFKFSGEPVKEFECAFCLCIIKDATELPSVTMLCVMNVWFTMNKNESKHNKTKSKFFRAAIS